MSRCDTEQRGERAASTRRIEDECRENERRKAAFKLEVILAILDIKSPGQYRKNQEGYSLVKWFANRGLVRWLSTVLKFRLLRSAEWY
jgi:hypothetical protein